MLAALCLLFAATGCKQSDNEVWVFGDSLSAVNDSWVYQAHERDYAVFHNAAQSGLRWQQFTAPDWLYCADSEKTRRKVLIWLGTNDALQTNFATVADRVQLSLDILARRGCRVYIVLPPAGWPWDMGKGLRYDEVRREIAAAAEGYDRVTVHEVEFEWNDTLDGLHPTKGHHLRLAVRMAEILDLAWRVETEK